MAKKSLGYNEAIREIEEILAKIEDGEIEVDMLMENVKRVSELLAYCKSTLLNTEMEVKKIIEDLAK